MSDESRAGLRLARPKVTAYRTADRTTVRTGLNRSCDRVIGAYVRVGRRCVGVTWARSIPVTPTEYARRVVEAAAREVRLP